MKNRKTKKYKATDFFNSFDKIFTDLNKKGLNKGVITINENRKI